MSGVSERARRVLLYLICVMATQTGALAAESMAQVGPRGGSVGWINVTDLGAKGDGITDDTSSLQNAFKTARTTRRSIYLPAGRYLVSASLDGTRLTSPDEGYEGVRVFGDGSGFTQVIGKLSRAHPIFDFTGTQRLHLSGIRVIGHPAGNQSAGILLAREQSTLRGDEPYLEDVMVMGVFSKVALAVVSADLSLMIRCELIGPKALVYGATDVEGVTSAYQEFARVTGNTLHRFYGGTLMAQRGISAIRFDSGTEIIVRDTYVSLLADTGIQAAVETTGVGGDNVILDRVRVETSHKITSHYILATSSISAGVLAGNGDLKGGPVIKIPAGKGIGNFLVNILLSNPLGIKMVDGGGDVRNSIIFNPQNLAATVGGGSWNNIIMQQSSSVDWGFPAPYTNIYMKQTSSEYTRALIGTKSGGGTRLSGTTVWAPSVLDGSIGSTIVPVPGARVGDPVVVGFKVRGGTPAGVLVSASVTSENTVTVTVFNKSGNIWSPGTGELRIDVSQY